MTADAARPRTRGLSRARTGPFAGLGPLSPPQPRRPGLDFGKPCPPDWMDDSFVTSCLLNGYSVVFPPLESLMMKYVAMITKDTTAPVDHAVVRGFIQQEGSHAREHRRSLDSVAAQGFTLDKMRRRIDRSAFGALDLMLKRVLRPLFGDAFAIGIFAAAEHWTAVLSESSLLPGERRASVGRMESAEAPTDLTEMEVLFLWHIAEELEHKCVVSDVFAALGGGEAARIGSFLLATPVFLLLSGYALVALLRQAPAVLGAERWSRLGWRGLAREVRWDLGDLPPVYGKAIRDYLRRGFRPQQHDTDALVRAAFDRLYAVKAITLP